MYKIAKLVHFGIYMYMYVYIYIPKCTNLIFVHKL